MIGHSDRVSTYRPGYILAVFGVMAAIFGTSTVFLLPLPGVACIGLLSAAFFPLWLSKRIYKDLLSPMSLMGTVWLSAMGLATLRLTNTQQQWGELTWFVLLGSLFAFMGGCFTVLLVTSLRGKIHYLHLGSGHIPFWDRRRFKKTIWVFFLVCFSAYLYQAYRLGTVPILAPNIRSARLSFALRYIHYLAYLVTVTGFLSYVYLRRFGLKKNISIGLVFILSELAALSMIAAGYVIFSATLIVVAENFVGKRIGLKVIVLTLIAMIIFFTIMITRREAAFSVTEVTNWDAPDQYASFAFPYRYYTIGLEGMRFVIEDAPMHYHYGTASLAPVWAFTLTKDYFDFQVYGTNLVVFTYLSPFYQDFGVPGALLLPFGLGVFSTFLYQYALLRRSIFVIVIYSVVAYNLLFAFFVNHFTRPVTWVVFASLFLFDRVCHSQKTISRLTERMTYPSTNGGTL